MTDKALKSLQSALLNAGIQNVYIGELPELQTDCVALKPVHGYANTMYFAQRDIVEPLVQILTRAKEYLEGTRMSEIAMKTLNKFSDETAGILQAQITGSPGYLGRNQNGFGEWSCVLHVTLTKY